MVWARMRPRSKSVWMTLAGERFLGGVLLYDGTQTLPMGGKRPINGPLT